MSAVAKVLAVDDTPENLRLLDALLTPRGYQLIAASSGAEALALLRTERPDILLVDIVMPEMNGYEVTKRVRADPDWRHLPIIMITATGGADLVRSLDAGADDFVSKPFDQHELLARVKSLLRVKSYYDTVQRQREELSRFFSPQIAELITSDEGKRLLDGHRRAVTVVFSDLRGFTTFSETVEPEEVLSVLRTYHRAMGELIAEHGGTLEHFEGDGMMVFFNDPAEMDDHEVRAVRMAIAMRNRFTEIAVPWKKKGYDLAFGVGIAVGYATLGRIGFEGRYDYAAIGNVTILASRLSGRAEGGQILVSQRLNAAIEDEMETVSVGDLELKGMSRPVPAFNVVRAKS
ncbi:MAG TPA: response regulator [Candidatus Limnocylindrales bacterium]|nr:response regulator [Candidatus Limnocylindrales bacterium]